MIFPEDTSVNLTFFRDFDNLSRHSPAIKKKYFSAFRKKSILLPILDILKKDLLIAAAIIVLLALISLGIAALSFEAEVDDQAQAKATSATDQISVSQNKSPVARLEYEVLDTRPHDKTAFTQGLQFENGILYEGTGLYGKSVLKRYDARSGAVSREVKLPDTFFGEGIAVAQGRLFQLTWKEQKAFVYDKTTFQMLGEFSYPGEGWGLTFDGKSLIMSDGTENLRFLNPDTFAEEKRIRVMSDGQDVKMLNELEFVNGEIYANIWQTDRIVRISPTTGEVTGELDLTNLLSAEERTPTTDVLNGIAYDAENDTFFITGKNWPRLFVLKIREQGAENEDS